MCHRYPADTRWSSVYGPYTILDPTAPQRYPPSPPMVTVDQQTVEAIRSARLRLREITLPVRYGRLENAVGVSSAPRRPCPVRRGKPATLVARLPYREHRRQAEREPTRARAVLRLIDLCSAPRKTVQVTPTSVERVGETWLVRFVKGDQSTDSDPLFLSRSRDYTTVRDELDAGEVILPTAEARHHAHEKAREKRELPASNGAAALRLAHRKLALRRHTMTVNQRRQLDRTGKAIQKLADELALDSSGIFGESDRVQSPTPAELDGESKPTGQGDLRLGSGTDGG